jgi:N-acetyldiaminopimelate deacetylase
MKSLTPLQLRHKLHQNPEIAYHEFNTTKLILNNIQLFQNSKKLKFHTPYPTGALIEYKTNDEPYILFRADIDALPIKEENEIEFKSKNNFMHACGHDVHSSILYGFIQKILESNPNKNLLFLFQPAEESGGGAMKFYDTGIFRRFEIRNAFALHVTDEYKLNTIASTPRVLFASALELDVEFFGISSHVAFPNEGKNAFNALRNFMDEVDKIPKEINNPIVFAPGKIYAGDVRNIIPGYAKFESTIRALSQNKVNEFVVLLERILAKVKQTTGVNFKISRGAHYPEVIVDKHLFDILSKEFQKKYNFIDCGYKMTGEDFGFFSQRYSSFMFWLGTSTGKRYGLHNPRFLPDDLVIDFGIKAFELILNSV